MSTIRAIYHDGHLRLLDPVDLAEGEQVQIHITSAQIPPVPIRELVADMLAKPLNPSKTPPVVPSPGMSVEDLVADMVVKYDFGIHMTDEEAEALQQALDEELAGLSLRPLSEIIIEDRGPY